MKLLTHVRLNPALRGELEAIGAMLDDGGARDLQSLGELERRLMVLVDAITEQSAR